MNFERAMLAFEQPAFYFLDSFWEDGNAKQSIFFLFAYSICRCFFLGRRYAYVFTEMGTGSR